MRLKPAIRANNVPMRSAQGRSSRTKDTRQVERVLEGLEYDVKEGDELALSAEALAMLDPFTLGGLASEGYVALEVGACSSARDNNSSGVEKRCASLCSITKKMLGATRFWWSEVWFGAFDPRILSVKAGLVLSLVPSKQSRSQPETEYKGIVWGTAFPSLQEQHLCRSSCTWTILVIVRRRA